MALRYTSSNFRITVFFVVEVVFLHAFWLFFCALKTKTNLLKTMLIFIFRITIFVTFIDF